MGMTGLTSEMSGSWMNARPFSSSVLQRRPLDVVVPGQGPVAAPVIAPSNRTLAPQPRVLRGPLDTPAATPIRAGDLMRRRLPVRGSLGR